MTPWQLLLVFPVLTLAVALGVMLGSWAMLVMAGWGEDCKKNG